MSYLFSYIFAITGLAFGLFLFFRISKYVLQFLFSGAEIKIKPLTLNKKLAWFLMVAFSVAMLISFIAIVTINVYPCWLEEHRDIELLVWRVSRYAFSYMPLICLAFFWLWRMQKKNLILTNYKERIFYYFDVFAYFCFLMLLASVLSYEMQSSHGCNGL